MASVLSLLAAAKRQYFDHLSFNFILKLINGISSDCQKLLRYVNGTPIVVSLKIPSAPSATVTVSLNNLALSFKDLKLPLIPISTSKLVVSSLE